LIDNLELYSMTSTNKITFKQQAEKMLFLAIYNYDEPIL